MFDAELSSNDNAGRDRARAARRLACVDRPRESDWTSVKLSELLPLLGGSTEDRFNDVTFPVRKVHAGETLHRAGDKFNAIHVVRSGFFKTVSVDAAGTELVLGFPMGGEVLGVDGVDSGRYTTDVVALDISSVAVIPFEQLSQLAHQHPCIERLLYSIFARELAHKHTMFRLLGTLSAEARLATFLLDLSDRFGRLGYSRSTFALRATRQEIGSYLGMKLETVSRTLSAFATAGLVDIDRRQIALRDVARLRGIADSTAVCAKKSPLKQPITSAIRRAVRALPMQTHYAMAA